MLDPIPFVIASETVALRYPSALIERAFVVSKPNTVQSTRDNTEWPIESSEEISSSHQVVKMWTIRESVVASAARLDPMVSQVRAAVLGAVQATVAWGSWLESWSGWEACVRNMALLWRDLTAEFTRPSRVRRRVAPRTEEVYLDIADTFSRAADVVGVYVQQFRHETQVIVALRVEEYDYDLMDSLLDREYDLQGRLAGLTLAVQYLPVGASEPAEVAHRSARAIFVREVL